MSAFKTAAASRFEAGLAAHVRTYFPNHSKIAGETGTGTLARLALARARSHGIESERGVYLYLNVMLILGSYFDEDPQLP